MVTLCGLNVSHSSGNTVCLRLVIQRILCDFPPLNLLQPQFSFFPLYVLTEGLTPFLVLSSLLQELLLCYLLLNTYQSGEGSGLVLGLGRLPVPGLEKDLLGAPGFPWGWAASFHAPPPGIRDFNSTYFILI